MIVDRKPFSSCTNFVNVALVWQLLILPLSGKCSTATQMIAVVKIPINFSSKISVKPQVNKNERNVAMKSKSNK